MIRRVSYFDCFLAGMAAGATACGIFCGSVIWIFGKKYTKNVTNETEESTIDEEIPEETVVNNVFDEELEDYERTLKEAGYDTEV